MLAMSLSDFKSKVSEVMERLTSEDILVVSDDLGQPIGVVMKPPTDVRLRNKMFGNLIALLSQEVSHTLPSTVPASRVKGRRSRQDNLEQERELFRGKSPELWDYYMNTLKPIVTHGNDTCVSVYRTNVPDLRATIGGHGGLYARIKVRRRYLVLRLTVTEARMKETGLKPNANWPGKGEIRLYPSGSVPKDSIEKWVEIAYQEAVKRVG